MKNLKQLPNKQWRCVFTDIDGTLTDQGRIGPKAYEALWRLHDAGIQVVPVTGRPAGWCEMIARTWPVHSVIGENGAFYFSLQDSKMQREFLVDSSLQKSKDDKFGTIKKEIAEKVPGAAVASDQFTRMFDLAIDFAEDVKPLDDSEIQKIVDCFRAHGATAKVSNIHVNGWFGQHDKLSVAVICQNQKNLANGHQLLLRYHFSDLSLLLMIYRDGSHLHLWKRSCSRSLAFTFKLECPLVYVSSP
jgi:HAD superfamily hydrolase (TIGR01484 family)